MDKRITLSAFKQNLEPFVGVTSTQFKVFRVYANNQEFESVRLNETLSSFSDDNKVSPPCASAHAVIIGEGLRLILGACLCTNDCYIILVQDNHSLRKSLEERRVQSEGLSAARQ